MWKNYCRTTRQDGCTRIVCKIQPLDNSTCFTFLIEVPVVHTYCCSTSLLLYVLYTCGTCMWMCALYFLTATSISHTSCSCLRAAHARECYLLVVGALAWNWISYACLQHLDAGTLQVLLLLYQVHKNLVLVRVREYEHKACLYSCEYASTNIKFEVCLGVAHY